MGMEDIIPTIVTGGVVLKFSEAAFEGGKKSQSRARRTEYPERRRRSRYSLSDRYSPF